MAGTAWYEDMFEHPQPRDSLGDAIPRPTERLESALAAAEEQLAQSRKMEAVGRLAGGIAHDFNNMLTVILASTELALSAVEPAEPVHTLLRAIEDAARHSAELNQRLLAFTRRQIIEPQVLLLNDVVPQSLKLLRPLIGENIRLTWRPAGDLWPIEIDRYQVEQILANLCLNARDAIADVGEIVIETANTVLDETYCGHHAWLRPGDYATLTVSDTGCGMDETTRAHLFEPFFTTKSGSGGTGLGLATVYGIVLQNNGLIEVASEPGQGTTFSIHLPRTVAGITEDEEGGAPKVQRAQGETVLVVEDENAILELMQKLLEELGYKTLIAGRPTDAMRLVEAYPGDIDLLVSDVIMPEMSGRDLYRRLLPLKPGLRCLYISGYSADVVAPQGVFDEGVQFLQKPFALKDLSLAVRGTLQASPAHHPSSATV